MLYDYVSAALQVMISVIVIGTEYDCVRLTHITYSHKLSSMHGMSCKTNVASCIASYAMKFSGYSACGIYPNDHV